MVFETLRLFIKPIWNAFNFFTIYANTDGIKAKRSFASGEVLDKYILCKLKISVQAIKASLDAFDTQEAYRAVGDFFEVLNNWYIRRSRSRFWQEELNEFKISAYDTLFTCLEVMSIAASSIVPVISEAIYLGLKDGKAAQDSGAKFFDAPRSPEDGQDDHWS